ncbi:MarR family winged helix-turn-helix transcriptional regulator [Labedaea rhizosphaerae]|uniref:DNA-binding MarR family transcriptional regulator n=1 Tax=Labedaea rhizosphaerae TaxID=598644 RepID=A0A4R6S585_LABRH|nr:MarR family transcriptional regulator [Labedaea rhizosphaerae]TDP94949.1 DNA-binding MarR family transcriptional regulator [Labedaea rhizosphaerae]
MTQPEPIDPAAAVGLGREFATALVVFHEAVGRLLGLSAVERKCIDLLKQLGPVTAGAIGERTGLTTGAVTRLIDRLGKAGYVERVPDPDDRRKVVVRLLPNERMDALMASAFIPFGEDLAKVMANYTEAETRVILDWVHRTTEVLVANTRRIEHQQH